jgi:isoleucyl-tRNA synthetase
MAMADVVGSMGLTLFCNKCVEVFYRFRKDQQVDPEEFESTCNMARDAFESLRSPEAFSAQLSDRYSLFNTNEEVMSFAKMVEQRSEKAEELVVELLANIESVSSEQVDPIERKKAAESLQKFFDVLGDYSFDATRERLRRDVAVREV